jgi:8-oxo-dGTP diphosphatase
MADPIRAAGGIVLRGYLTRRIAIVQQRKYGHWVLPKGKLNRDESARAAARREVLEETGHQVSVHEFIGSLCYEVNDRPKIVQFWRMRARSGRTRKLMTDIKAVQWLPLGSAIEKLTHRREQVFLRSIGPAAIKADAASVRMNAVRETLELMKRGLGLQDRPARVSARARARARMAIPIALALSGVIASVAIAL